MMRDDGRRVLAGGEDKTARKHFPFQMRCEINTEGKSCFYYLKKQRQVASSFISIKSS